MGYKKKKEQTNKQTHRHRQQYGGPWQERRGEGKMAAVKGVKYTVMEGD